MKHEECVILGRKEVAWVTWVYICQKFGFDPFKTDHVLLYCTRANQIDTTTERAEV